MVDRYYETEIPKKPHICPPHTSGKNSGWHGEVKHDEMDLRRRHGGHDLNRKSCHGGLATTQGAALLARLRRQVLL